MEKHYPGRKKLLKFLMYFFILLAILPMVLILILHLPVAEKYIRDKATQALSAKLKTKVRVNKISIGFLNGLYLEGLYLEDQHKDTLLYAGKLGININLLRLSQKEISISAIKLENAYVNTYRASGREDFNFNFIADAFKDTTTTQASSWKFDLKSVTLKEMRLRYDDTPGGTFINSEFKLLEVYFKNLGMENNHLVIDNADLEGMLLAFNFKTPETINTDTTSKNIWTFSAEDINIYGSRFIYNDYTKPAFAKGVDYNRMDISEINGSVKDLLIQGANIALAVKKLALKEKSGFILEELSGRLNIAKAGIEIEIEKFNTPRSDLHDKLALYIPLEKDSGMEEMKLEGDLENEKIAMYDLQFFVPGLDTLQMLQGKILTMSGNLRGKMNDFTFNNIDLSIDERNGFRGNISVKGLPEFKTASVVFNLEDLYCNTAMLKSFISEQKTGIKINALGNVRVKGNIKGNVTNPDIRLTANTGIGNIFVNVKLKTDTAFRSIAYEGNIFSAGFDIGKLVKDVPLGKITMRSYASGHDDEVKKLNAAIVSLEYNQYTYRNLSINASMLNKVISAEFRSDDTSFTADLRFTTDLKSNKYDAEGNIKKADLYAMHFMPSPFIIQTTINASLEGKNIDSLRGHVNLYDLTLDNSVQKYAADSVSTFATLENGIHTITLNSDEIKGSLSGQFKVEELPLILSDVMKRYQQPSYKAEEFLYTRNIELNLQAGNISHLAKIFVPEITMLDSLNIKGAFKKEGYTFSFNSSVRNFTYADNELKGIFINASGENDKMNFFLGARSISSGKDLIMEKALASGNLSAGKARFNIKMYDQKAPTRFDIDGALAFDKDTVLLHIPSAEIFIKGKKWDLNKNNMMAYAPGYLMVKDFAFIQGEQKILVNSQLNKNANLLKASFEKVSLSDIGDLAGFSSYKMQGRLNGKLTATDLFASQGIDADIKVDSFGLNNILLGNLIMAGRKKAGVETVSLHAKIEGAQNNANLDGQISLVNTHPLNFNIRIGRLALHPLEPLVKSFAYSLNGNISGDFKMTGNGNAPVLTGILMFNGQNRIGVNLSHTIYKIKDQKIIFNEASVQFNNFIFQDTLDNKILVKGFIYHKGFQHMRFDMALNTDNFELINSGFTADVLAYGQLFTKMNIKLAGPLENLIIDLDMATLKGTKLFIPLASAKPTGALPSYVHFDEIEAVGMDTLSSKKEIDEIDKVNKSMKAPHTDLSKFNIRGKLRITKDAILNIVVDPVNGDKITTLGNGTFTLDFDSENNINLYGVYAIDSGSYNFSFVNLVKKNFSIGKGSTISWAGDFQNATLNIMAIYKTKASRYDLISDQSGFLSQEQIDAAKRPLPVEVNLKLTGQLLSPVISFNIKIPEGGDPLSGGLVTQQINQINNDPNEVTKQVFSLIVLNKFMPQTGIGGGGLSSGSDIALNQVNQSVSRVLNAQLNKLTDVYLKGLDFNVNIQSLDQSYGPLAQNAQAKVTKKINDRISVSAGGNVNINSNYGSGQFAGDYNIYYRVNQEGTVNLRFFRTSLQSMYTNNLNTQSGFSVNYKRDFNRWRRIFNRRKDSRREAGNKKSNEDS